MIEKDEPIMKEFFTDEGKNILQHHIVFVDGEIFQGQVVYDNLKGVGWKSGRTAGLYLTGVARYQKVQFLNTRYGKLRDCTFKSNGQDLKSMIKNKETYWDVEVLPQDT